MPRRARVAPGGYVYHVLNRTAGRFRMLRREKDFLAFERLIVEAQRLHPMRILAWCLMGNHWHFIVWPREDGELSAFFRWLAHTHAMRFRVAHRSVGYGHLYQGRFKNFPIQADAHLLGACRYVERNAMSAGLVKRAQDWRWSSLWIRENGTDEQKQLLTDWPVDRPNDWLKYVNAPWSEKELERLRQSRDRGRPFGEDGWTQRLAKKLDLQHTLRREGRPNKKN